MSKERDDAEKKKFAEAYEAYSSEFVPKPKYVRNCFKAFLTGGLICACALLMQKGFMKSGMNEEAADSYVIIVLIMAAQLLTGLGLFERIARFSGAGVMVPITGFANAMVAPALEYKQEGFVLGVGAKLFTLAGPVLVCGIGTSVLIGIIHWVIGQF